MPGESLTRLEPESAQEAVPDTEPKPEPDPESAATPAAPPTPQPVRLSRWSRIALVAAAGLIALTTAAQCAAMFLDAAPANTISRKYNAQIKWWISPWFGQNWKLFGPNPQTENLTVLARARTADGSMTSWVDLTAIDYAAVEHDPMPSHANENELRLAIDAYDTAKAGSSKQSLMQQYLTDFVALRLGVSTAAGYTDIQIETFTNPMPLPGTTAAPAPTNHYLPWWKLAVQNGSGR